MDVPTAKEHVDGALHVEVSCLMNWERRYDFPVRYSPAMEMIRSGPESVLRYNFASDVNSNANGFSTF